MKDSAIHSRWIMIAPVLFGVVLLTVLSRPVSAAPGFTVSPDGLWHEVNESAIQARGPRWVVPDRYRTLGLDLDLLTARLAGAPLEYTSAAGGELPVISLPLPDESSFARSGYGRFRFVDSPVMAPELAAQFPQIKTYAAVGIDDPTAYARIDLTPHGFHAMILTTSGTIYVDPYQRSDTVHYVSYFVRDFTLSGLFQEYGPLGGAPRLQANGREPDAVSGLDGWTSGAELRTYRTAIAATGEYTQYFGGTVPDALAEINTLINRITGIYEREVAVRMVLIPNETAIIYTNPATDPYTNDDGVAMLQENQTNLDLVIGSGNYDIGHAVSTGGGGVAYLGVTCQAGWKAQGVTGSPNPTGDPFYVDYVAHEMGHQFGANHSFNGTYGSCGGGNRNGSTAYEPGSGSTIMSYAGICDGDDLQPHSDDTFHSISFAEIVAYTTQDAGNTCPVITDTGNQPPTVEAGTGGFTIPKNTPFTLRGSATDPDGDPLTYSWEEFDLGPAGHPNNPSGNAPIFRSFLPVADSTRIFPKLSDLLNNTHTIGELLPSYTRALTFRLTARDNHISPSAGGVAYDTIAFSVTGNAGPFLVTAPNTPVIWQAGTNQSVTWNVANTNLAPVSCYTVTILLSTDGGYTYPLTLANSVPNDGLQSVYVPSAATTTARVKVACATSIFFDISNVNFTIQVIPFAQLSLSKTVVPASDLTPGADLTYTLAISNSGITTATATIQDAFPVGIVDPVCAGVPGDLNKTIAIPASGEHSILCGAQVSSTLSVAVTQTIDAATVFPGQSVTFTWVVANPSGILTLTEVIVDDPVMAGCTGGLSTPFSLGPLESRTVTCANVIVTHSITSTAVVTAFVTLSNTALASAPEDPDGPIDSNTVMTRVVLSNQDSAAVIVKDWLKVYLPWLVRERSQ